MDFLTDTTFLIDLWREQRKPGRAMAFARQHREKVAGLPWIVMGEFLRGVYCAGLKREDVSAFLDGYIVVWPSPAVVDAYARLYAALKRLPGAMVGPNDLWIAATSLAHELPLVTRNAVEFRKVPDLTVWDYTESGSVG